MLTLVGKMKLNMKIYEIKYFLCMSIVKLEKLTLHFQKVHLLMRVH
jgi:hypothetical protein